jgi:hypothetical protein
MSRSKVFRILNKQKKIGFNELGREINRENKLKRKRVSIDNRLKEFWDNIIFLCNSLNLKLIKVEKFFKT